MVSFKAELQEYVKRHSDAGKSSSNSTKIGSKSTNSPPLVVDMPLVVAVQDTNDFMRYSLLRDAMALASGMSFAFDGINPRNGLAYSAIVPNDVIINTLIRLVEVRTEEAIRLAIVKECSEMFSQISLDGPASMLPLVLRMCRIMFSHAMAAYSSASNIVYWNGIHSDSIVPFLNQILNDLVISDRVGMDYEIWFGHWKRSLMGLPSVDVLAVQTRLHETLVPQRTALFLELLMITHAPLILFTFYAAHRRRSRSDVQILRMADLGMSLFVVYVFEDLYTNTQQRTIVLSGFQDIMSQCLAFMAEGALEGTINSSPIQQIVGQTTVNRDLFKQVVQGSKDLHVHQTRLVHARNRVQTAEQKKRLSLMWLIVWVVLGSALAMLSMGLVFIGNYASAILIASILLTFLVGDLFSGSALY
jgi:hypothetical protein